MAGPEQDPLPLPDREAMEAAARRARRLRREEAWRRGASAHPRVCTCGASLLWALTTTEPPGWMPLGAAPDPAGTAVVIRDGAAPIAHINPPAALAGLPACTAAPPPIDPAGSGDRPDRREA